MSAEALAKAEAASRSAASGGMDCAAVPRGTISPKPALSFSVDSGDHDDKDRASDSPDNRSPKGPGSAPRVPLDTTKGHRDDEKNNIREQGAHGNLTQNTSHRRSG
ncbi:hypothetical protein [Bradyrhizobium sp. RDI18]|uniref:hypothetical protein n=1 Tax=Bradyrhizobium sp. RDI18 TaxID=3367400 RepID=UPI003723D124